MNTRVNTSAVPISDELNGHLADALSALRSLRNWRPSSWTLALAIVIAFAAGTYIGVNAGAESERRLQQMADANHRRMEGMQIAKGELEMRNFNEMRSYDNLVSDVAARGEMPFWWSLRMRMKFWILNVNLDRQMPGIESDLASTSARSVAEHRLKVFEAVQPATREELNKRGIEEQAFAKVADWRKSIARDYTTVLGRPVKVEQLITDVDMRREIRIHDIQRASLEPKSP
jgi:hypothetical protein